MTNRQEMILCGVLALAGLLGIVAIKKRSKEVKRGSISGEAVVSDGESVDPHLAQGTRLKGEASLPGAKKIVVAVIDTGCDVYHPDLSDKMWRNPGESGKDKYGRAKESNGIDDDANGFVDDVYGWNFSAASSDVFDEHGHGTHIAGIIGGVDSNVELMILKYFDEGNDGLKNLRATISAIRYAVKMGADIINYSGGGTMRSVEEEETLRWAASHHVLVVAAAGNEGSNSDFNHFYPADYEFPNILSVAATDRSDNLLRSSNFGMRTVHVAAPGKNIYSTLPHGLHGYMSGTSQATAYASGVAALLLMRDPSLRDPERVIRQLIETSSPRPALRAKLFSGGVLNAELTLKSLASRDREVSSTAGSED